MAAPIRAVTPRRKMPSNGEDSSVLPHSLEAEQAVLGGLLLDASAWNQVADLINETDFHRPDHQLIFEAIGALVGAGKPCDVVTLSEQLERTRKLEAVGGLAYLSSLARNTPTAANVRAYADIVRERSGARRLIELGRSAESLVANGATVTDLVAAFDGELSRMRRRVHAAAQPLDIEPASAWAARPEPAPRDWIVEGLIPAGRVTSMLGNGGLGKTLLAVQLGVHISMNRPIFGHPVSGGPVLGIFCEDELEELERRARAACAGEDIALESLERLHMTSRDGLDNLLCTFEREQIQATPFYRQLDATVAALKPRLTILDTAADLFGGDFLSTPHVRQFLKVCLGGLCVRHGTAVLLLAHPSASAISSGDGGGFSTAWNNSVRSRLYLRRPKTEDKDAAKDRRVLEVMKSNYAPDGTSVALLYDRGYFVPDQAPVDEGAKVARVTKPDTRLAMAVLEQLRKLAPQGVVVRSGAILQALQTAGTLSRPTTDAEAERIRKTLQRTLRQLCEENLVIASTVPRGYRLAGEQPAERAA